LLFDGLLLLQHHHTRGLNFTYSISKKQEKKKPNALKEGLRGSSGFVKREGGFLIILCAKKSKYRNELWRFGCGRETE